MSKTNSTLTVTSAVKLTAAQIEKIEKAYKKQTGQTATVASVIDESVIGGIKITAGSTQIDGTIKNKLQTIRTQLLNI